jgi:tetratricopeptide (TPR) repeat protein
MTFVRWALALALAFLSTIAIAVPAPVQQNPTVKPRSRTAIPAQLQKKIEELRQNAKRFPASASAHLELGIALSDAGLFDQARAEFKVALKLHPNDAATTYNLGLTDLRAAQSVTASSSHYYGLLDSAHDLLVQAANLDPRLPRLHLNLGYLNHKLGDQEATIEEYKKAVEVEPQSAEAHNDLGSALADVERYPDALEEYRKAFALNPRSSSTLMNLEGVVRRTGTAAGLFSDSDAALQNAPDSLPDRLLHGLALYLNGKGDLALQDFGIALKKDPDLAAAHFFRGEILREKGAVKDSAAEYAHAARLAPERTDYAARQASALITLGDFKAAELILRRVLQRNPDDSSVHFQLGRVLRELDQRDAADKEFAAASRLKKKANVEGVVAMDLLDGVQKLRSGSPGQALEKFRDAQSLSPDLPEANFYLAIALSQTGDLKSATQAFEKALQKRPSSAEIHYNFGIALWQGQQAERAIAEFRKAIYLRPDYGLARCALGMALLRTGLISDGKAEVERSQQLGVCRPASGSQSP